MLFDISLIPEPVRQLASLLDKSSTYVVGGILRDSIATSPDSNIVRHAIGQDWDIATPLHPREVTARLRKSGITVAPIGIEHGTVAAVIENISYEITTFRHDVEYTDGRHPIVRFAATLEEDLERRDFTINAMALHIETGKIIDRFNGIDDLRSRIVRTVGNPVIRFREDYLRMLRAARFAAKLQGTIETETFAAIAANAPLIQSVSPERVRDEILKMLTYSKPSHGFALLHECGLLRYILPELDAGFGIGQNRFHSDDVAWHTLHSVDALNPRYPFLRFITLLHDLGKVPAKKYLERKGDYVFYGHQYISRGMARRIMHRLRFSNKDIETACVIVENHMYNLKPGLSKGATRRFLRKLKRENIDAFLRMRMADRKGNRFNNDGYEKGLFHFMRAVRQIDRDEDALTVQKLHVNGYDLMNLGLRPGPIFSQILNLLLDEVLDDPALNDREWLLRKAQEYADEFKMTGTLSIPVRRQPEEEDGQESERDSDRMDGSE